jgi:hypothetical protein
MTVAGGEQRTCSAPRATLAGPATRRGAARVLDDAQARLVARYVDAFERYDVAGLTALLHEDGHALHAP